MEAEGVAADAGADAEALRLLAVRRAVSPSQMPALQTDSLVAPRGTQATQDLLRLRSQQCGQPLKLNRLQPRAHCFHRRYCAAGPHVRARQRRKQQRQPLLLPSPPPLLLLPPPLL